MHIHSVTLFSTVYEIMSGCGGALYDLSEHICRDRPESELLGYTGAPPLTSVHCELVRHLCLT